MYVCMYVCACVSMYAYIYVSINKNTQIVIKQTFSFSFLLCACSYGLNAIRLPVGYWYFAEKAGLDSSPYLIPDEDLYDEHHPITDVIRWAKDAGLHVSLVMNM